MNRLNHILNQSPKVQISRIVARHINICRRKDKYVRNKDVQIIADNVANDLIARMRHEAFDTIKQKSPARCEALKPN